MAYVSLVRGVSEMRLVSRRHLILRQVGVRALVVWQCVGRPLVLRLVRLSRLMGYRSMARIGILVVRKLGVGRVGTRIAALLDLKLLCRIPLLLRLLLIRGIGGRAVLWGERRLVVVGLVVFGLVRSSRLGHGRRLLEGRGIVIRARHNGEAIECGKRDASLRLNAGAVRTIAVLGSGDG
jgi:hypothetical protein